jgi:hypothetical protein
MTEPTISKPSGNGVFPNAPGEWFGRMKRGGPWRWFIVERDRDGGLQLWTWVDSTGYPLGFIEWDDHTSPIPNSARARARGGEV